MSETPYSLRKLPKGSYIPEGHYGAVTQAAKNVLRNSEGRWDAALGTKGVQRSDPKSYLQPINTATALVKYRLYSVDALTQIAPDFVLSVDTPDDGSPYFHLVTEDDHGANDGALLKLVGLYEPVRVQVSDTADFVPQLGKSCGPDETGRADSSYTGYVCISSVETVESVDTVWIVQHNTQAIYAEATETIPEESRGLFKALKRNRDTDAFTDLSFLPNIEAYTLQQINSGSRVLLVPVHRLGWMAVNSTPSSGGGGDDDDTCLCDLYDWIYDSVSMSSAERDVLTDLRANCCGGTVGKLVECTHAAGLPEGDGYLVSPMEVQIAGVTLTTGIADLKAQGEDWINSVHEIPMTGCSGAVAFRPIYLDNFGQPQNDVVFTINLDKIAGNWQMTISVTGGVGPSSSISTIATASDDVSIYYAIPAGAVGADIDASGMSGGIQPVSYSAPATPLQHGQETDGDHHRCGCGHRI